LLEPGHTKSTRAIVLVGFMGAGKTVVGEAVAKRLGWEFLDLDHHIQLRAERTISAIFQQSGEPEFRRLELEVLHELLLVSHSSSVIAFGGGTYIQEPVRDLLAAGGFPSVFLDAPEDELWDRCSRQGLDRPLASDREGFATLYRSRYPHYLRASLRVETSNKAIETIAAEVISALRLR
jgi:shikimate kinase